MKTQGKKASKSATQLEKQVGLQYNVNSRNGFLLTIIITYPVVDPEGPILQPREQIIIVKIAQMYVIILLRN